MLSGDRMPYETRTGFAAHAMRHYADMAPAIFRRDLNELAGRIAMSRQPVKLAKEFLNHMACSEYTTAWEYAVERIAEWFLVTASALERDTSDDDFFAEMDGKYSAIRLATPEWMQSFSNACHNGDALKFIPYGPYDPGKEATVEQQMMVKLRLSALGAKIRAIDSFIHC